MWSKAVQFRYFCLMLIFGIRICADEEPDEIIYTTAIRALSELRHIENSYMNHLANYIKSVQRKVELLKEYINTVAYKDVDGDDYVNNPLKSFGLVRRSHEDWPKLMAFIKDQGGSKDDLQEMEQLANRTPNSEDMKEALLGMYRIESFYDLQAADMAKGLLMGQKLKGQMSAPDYLELADYMYNRSEFRRAAQWYRLALNFLKEPQNYIAAKIYTPNREKLRKMFVISRLQEGSIDNLTDYLKELSLSPDIPLAHLKTKPPTTALEKGCRGEFKGRSNLVCRYNSTTTPFMRIAPLKEEEISKDPLIWLYHDVLYDSEISQLLNLSRKDMILGFTDNYTTPEEGHHIFQVRIYEGDGGELDTKLINRMADMSGLYVGNHTYLARINYGLGSHFEEHGDYVDLKKHPELVHEGDRMFTFLFYATDVPVGGATVFPAANVAIQPKKGNALFWYNLHDDGEPNPLSRHAVCPMIMGNRWVLTKSMVTSDQMFIKPCFKK
ncbi:hypothetical protein KR018_009587 [Drosophila ironensis]|nr:hypothetical protein KR018_009587 [Drosophila ironensis]